MADALTAQGDSSQPETRPGSILLARHGEPALSRRVRLSPDGYRAFWAQYEIGGIVPGQTAPQPLRVAAVSCQVLLTSSRRRSIESARVLAGDRDMPSHDLFIEAPLPPPPWPQWVKLSPKLWGFFARFWWWFFNHHEGQETRLQAEARAGRAADLLIAQAEGGRDVVVLAHGFFNFMIGRALKARGWRQTAGEGYKYWSTRRFERL